MVYFGHENLKYLNDNELINGLQINPNVVSCKTCEDCAFGKQHRNLFPNKSEI